MSNTVAGLQTAIIQFYAAEKDIILSEATLIANC